jgi:hypothetical protein
MKKYHLQDPGRDGKIILRWTFRKLDLRAWTALIWLWIGIYGFFCECGIEPSRSIKCREFLDYLRATVGLRSVELVS